MVPKYRSLCCQHVLGPLFGGHIPSSFWNNCNICCFGTQGFLAFCHYEAYLFVFPLQNVDLDKHISPRRSESNPPPFSVKRNPGLHRHICVRLQSSVEKWSQKKFLRYGLTQLQVIYLNRVLSRFSARLLSSGSLQTPQNCTWQSRPPVGQEVDDLERQFKTNNTGDEYGMSCLRSLRSNMIRI